MFLLNVNQRSKFLWSPLNFVSYGCATRHSFPLFTVRLKRDECLPFFNVSRLRELPCRVRVPRRATGCIFPWSSKRKRGNGPLSATLIGRAIDPQWTATRLGRLRSRLTPSPDALAKRASASASRFDCRGKLDPGSTGNEVPSSTVRRARSSGVILKFQPRYRSASRYPACSRRNFHAPLCLAPVKPRYGLLGIVTPRVNVEARGNFSKPPPASLRDFEINFMLAANASPRGAFGLPKLSTVSSRPQLDLVKSAKKSWSTVTST